MSEKILHVKIMLLGIALVFLLSGCLTLSPEVEKLVVEKPAEKPTHIIYFAYHHWHTSVVVEVASFAQQNLALVEHFHLANQKFVRVGWGDGDYFTGKSKTISTAAKALIASRYSAIQMLTYSELELRSIPSDRIVPLAVDEKGLRQLMQYLDDSVVKNVQGDALGLPSTMTDTGIFLQAKGHYGVFNNCNTWSGRALRVAGLPVSSRLTATGVFEQARKISELQRQAGLFRGP
jgi:uncharacterized protein (TIGR02117 family)